MPPVPLLRPTEVISIATLSIPNHSEVARGTLRGLIQRSGLTIDEFINKID